MDMMDNYDSRKIDRYEKDDLMVSTVSIANGNKPYETGIGHPLYNDGKIIVVEAYDDEESAQEGHNKWVDIMTTDPLPLSLEDCCNAEIGQMARNIGCNVIYERKNHE